MVDPVLNLDRVVLNLSEGFAIVTYPCHLTGDDYGRLIGWLQANVPKRVRHVRDAHDACCPNAEPQS